MTEEANDVREHLRLDIEDKDDILEDNDISKNEDKDDILEDNDISRNNKDSGTTKADVVVGNERKIRLSFHRIVSKIKKEKIYRQRIIHTAILCWSFVGLGWYSGMRGPVFPDLRQIIQEDVARAAWMFTVASFGYLAGSLVGGILYDKLNKVLLLAACSLGSGISTLLTPYCSTLAWMLFIRFIGGFFFGGLDTGGNADIIHVWGNDVDPYMQALHFAFSVGALCSPLATEPFLAGMVTVCNGSGKSLSNSSIYSTTTETITYKITYLVSAETKNTTSMLTDSSDVTDCFERPEDTNVQYAFIIAASFMLASAAGFIVLYVMLRRAKEHNAVSNAENESKRKEKSKRQTEMTVLVKTILLTLLSLLIAFYSDAEDSSAEFFMTYALDYLKWDKFLGSFAASVFWFSFGFGRFIGIFLVSCCKNSTLLTVYLLMLFLSYLGFLVSSILHYNPLIWVFIAVQGFSMSVIFPAILSWTSENIVHVSGKISALFLTAACSSGIVFPPLLGHLMDYYSPLWYVYILIIMAFSCILLYVVILIFNKYYNKSNTSAKDANKIEVIEETEMTLMKN